MTPVTDTRTEEERREQRLAALEAGNRIRSYRAALKADIRADSTAALAIGVIAHPPQDAATMPVVAVLRPVPGLGAQRTTAILRAAGVRAGTRKLNDLTDRERSALIAELTDHAQRRASRRSASNGGPL